MDDGGFYRRETQMDPTPTPTQCEFCGKAVDTDDAFFDGGVSYFCNEGCREDSRVADCEAAESRALERWYE